MVMLTDLANILRRGGLRVVEVPGWKENARPAYTGGFDPDGNLFHHTGGKDTNPNSLTDDYKYAQWLADIGRSDLPAPLCQISVGRSGTLYVCAAGRGNHAGKAKKSGPMPAGDGNYLYLGWECQNTGTEGWSKTQYRAMVEGAAVVNLAYGWPWDHTRAHKETSVTGKWDPGKLDMNKFRQDVRAEMIRRQNKTAPTTASGPDLVRILDRNMLVGRDPEVVYKELADDIERYNPHVLLLQEVSGYHPVLHRIAERYGFRAPTANKGSVEGRSSVVMSKTTVPRKRKVVNKLTRRWKGPKMGHWHIGRRMPMEVLKVGNKWVKFRAIHGPTGAPNGKNLPAWREMMTLLATNGAGVRPFFFSGDWNWPFTMGGVNSPKRMAKLLRAQRTLGGKRIEYAIHRGLNVSKKTLPSKGSDHVGTLYTVALKK